MKIAKGPGDFYELSYVPTKWISHFKYNVPVEYRYYQDGKWFVHEDYLPVEKPQLTASDSDYALLHLRRSAPRIIVDAAWKALARTHHPDVGGDEEVFKRLKAAYDRICGAK